MPDTSLRPDADSTDARLPDPRTPHISRALAAGYQVMAWCDALAAHSDDTTGLTCSYLSASHRATAQTLLAWMRAAGMDAHLDAVGNVVGRYRSPDPHARTLLTGSHYDTVRNGGKYDGRIGILLPIAVIAACQRRGETFPFHVDIIGFAEEEGLRFKTAYLGSSALTGHFDRCWLDRVDDAGISMRQAFEEAGLPTSTIADARHATEGLIGFLEIHIEQGPVLLTRGTPLGIVTAIAGSRRYVVALAGVANHAGTTPMTMRRDAAAAAAEIVLLVEARCTGVTTLVGTVGQLSVPGGSINVVPGECRLSIDIRAGDDAIRDAAVDDVMAGIEAICARRGIAFTIEQVHDAATTPCAPRLRRYLEAATRRSGCEIVELTSGAGHDAVEISRLTDVAMLFVRCGNGGISHNPLETVTPDDLDLAAEVFTDVLRQIASDGI